MHFTPHPFNGVFEITLSPFQDNRGYFASIYDKALFEAHGITTTWVRENQSLSTQKGVIRGLHFQFSPYTEAKLIRVVQGAIWDVFLDLRAGSATFGQWDARELSADAFNMLYLPRGMAHGFCTLAENTVVQYKVDNLYAPQLEGGIAWNDSELAIPWPVETPILSEKDQSQLTLRKFVESHQALYCDPILFS